MSLTTLQCKGLYRWRWYRAGGCRPPKRFGQASTAELPLKRTLARSPAGQIEHTLLPDLNVILWLNAGRLRQRASLPPCLLQCNTRLAFPTAPNTSQGAVQHRSSATSDKHSCKQSSQEALNILMAEDDSTPAKTSTALHGAVAGTRPERANCQRISSTGIYSTSLEGCGERT